MSNQTDRSSNSSQQCLNQYRVKTPCSDIDEKLTLSSRPIILLHGWIAVGKSTTLKELNKIHPEGLAYCSVAEHNTETSTALEVLDCFYNNLITKAVWENHQLINYWQQAMAALKNLDDQVGLIFDRSFIDVHTFMKLYLSPEDYNQLLPLYKHLLSRFMPMCLQKGCVIKPILVTRPSVASWRQFLMRNRSAEVKAFTYDEYVRCKQQYETETEETMNMLRKLYGHDIVMTTTTFDSLTPHQSAHELCKYLGLK